MNREQEAINKYPIPTSAKDCLFFWGHTNHTGKINQTCFSQWYPSKFTALIDGVLHEFQNAEQYMMAAKAHVFHDDIAFAMIMKTHDPKEMKKIGRMIRNFNEDTWKERRFVYVHHGNVRKFRCNQDLRDYLMATEDKYLAEASPYDTIWGIGKHPDEAIEISPSEWNGLNLLGLALMSTRDYFKMYGDLTP